ncbi:hypothetical protein D9M68_159010 [compost metagenome]
MTAKKTNSRKAEKFVVRLNDGQRDRLAQAADRNYRSMNAQLVAMIERGLAEDEARAAAGE